MSSVGSLTSYITTYPKIFKIDVAKKDELYIFLRYKMPNFEKGGFHIS